MKDYRTRFAAGQASSSKKDIVNAGPSSSGADNQVPESLAALANQIRDISAGQN